MFERNLQEMEGVMSPLPQSNCFDEMQSPSVSVMPKMTPNTTGYNRTLRVTIVRLLVQNKAISKIDMNTKGVSTQGSKVEVTISSNVEQKSTLDRESNESVVTEHKKIKAP